MKIGGVKQQHKKSRPKGESKFMQTSNVVHINETGANVRSAMEQGFEREDTAARSSRDHYNQKIRVSEGNRRGGLCLRQPKVWAGTV